MVPCRHARPNESLTTTPTSRPLRSRRLSADPRGGRVGIDGQQHERAGALRVRRVHAGRGADEAVSGLGDHERRARADDARALVEDDLHVPGIALAAGQLVSLLRRSDAVEQDDPALGLRHDLLHDDHDVAVLEAAGARGRLRDQRREIVPLLDLRYALEREDAQLARQGKPVTRRPACAL